MSLDMAPHRAMPEPASVQWASSTLTTLQGTLFAVNVCYNALIPEYRRTP